VPYVETGSHRRHKLATMSHAAGVTLNNASDYRTIKLTGYIGLLT